MYSKLILHTHFFKGKLQKDFSNNAISRIIIHSLLCLFWRRLIFLNINLYKNANCATLIENKVLRAST